LWKERIEKKNWSDKSLGVKWECLVVRQDERNGVYHLMIVNRGHTLIRGFGKDTIQVKPERRTLGDHFLFNARFDCIHDIDIHFVKGDTAARHARHLRNETNEDVGKLRRILPVGELLGSSINQGQSLELGRFCKNSFEDGEHSGWVNILLVCPLQSRRRKSREVELSLKMCQACVITGNAH